MEEDRFEKASREADAERLMANVKDDARGNRDAQILTTWGESLASRLDPILEGYPSMASGRGQFGVDVDVDGKNAELTYRQEGRLFALTVQARAMLDGGDSFRPGIIVGEGAGERINTAIMRVTVTRRDTGGSRSDEYEYGLQPVSKLTSVDETGFRAFLERLVRGGP